MRNMAPKQPCETLRGDSSSIGRAPAGREVMGSNPIISLGVYRPARIAVAP